MRQMFFFKLITSLVWRLQVRSHAIGLLVAFFTVAVFTAFSAGAQNTVRNKAAREAGTGGEPLRTGQTAKGTIVFAIHGGAGTIERGSMTPEREKLYRDKMGEALRAGYQILQNGGSSLDAVETAIRIMEDSPLFNAGKGAVFTSVGTNELDASIMEGKTMKAGAVASLKHIKNPISLARLA